MSKKAAIFLIGGGLTAGAAAFFAMRKAKQTVNVIREGVDQPPPPPGAPPAPMPMFKGRLTGYWPFTARADEKKMEGGVFDRMMPEKYKTQPDSQQYKDHVLHTLEDFQAGRAPFVSVSADDSLFPYGQRLAIDAWPGVIFRVVDTGGNFRGTAKVYRVAGYEPLDICVQSSKTTVPKTAIVMIYPGDNFAGQLKKGTVKDVAYNKFKDQTVAVTGIQEGRTVQDQEALARAVQSELGDRTREEQHAAAWAMRNRADLIGASLQQMLAPNGYGSPQKSGGYASTRRAPSASALALADEVLGAGVSDDPTGGAFDFWVPSAQERMRQLGDVHRAAKKSGDELKARRYERYADYADERTVRRQHARDGLKPVHIVGAVELLGVV